MISNMRKYYKSYLTDMKYRVYADKRSFRTPHHVWRMSYDQEDIALIIKRFKDGKDEILQTYEEFGLVITYNLEREEDDV